MAADVDFCILFLLFSAIILCQCQIIENEGWGAGEYVRSDKEWMHVPTVFVAVLVRNKAHTLPWFLHYLQALDYPKQRMRLWIRADHNEDNSVELLNDWLSHARHEYNYVDFVDDNSETSYSDGSRTFDWTAQRFANVINLRQQALDAARSAWADYILILDADAFLINNQVLRDLISADRLIVAPMLNATASETYSNFWCGFDDNGYYRRTDDYAPIRSRSRMGVFPVALVHSVILIHLRDPATRPLAYTPPPPGYHGPVDDIILLAHSAVFHGLAMEVMNKAFYGYTLLPMEGHNSLEEENEQFIHLKLENIVFDTPLQKLPYMNVLSRPLVKLSFDQIYMINLERRPDRRLKMEQCLVELGINASLVKAVDGRKLNDTYLKTAGIKMMEGYADPYGGRQMTMGEIGCFLSHYYIWQDILLNNYEKVIVFEDDVRFRPYFPQRLRRLMSDVGVVKPDWDLIYLGRKRLHTDDEPYVGEARTLVWPRYSYWTLSYMLTYKGAVKLVQQNPIKKMIPVDEYLPIMFNQHPEESWRKHFTPRDLIALSSYPLLVEPTHYTGEPGYITDTENSPVIAQDLVDRFKGDNGGPLLDIVESSKIHDSHTGGVVTSKTEL